MRPAHEFPADWKALYPGHEEKPSPFTQKRRGGKMKNASTLKVGWVLLALLWMLPGPGAAQDMPTPETDGWTKSNLLRQVVRGDIKQTQIIESVQRHCIRFPLTFQVRREFRQLGAQNPLLEALRTCQPRPGREKRAKGDTLSAPHLEIRRLEETLQVGGSGRIEVRVMAGSRPQEGVIVVTETSDSARNGSSQLIAQRTDPKGWARFSVPLPDKEQPIPVRITAPELQVQPETLVLQPHSKAVDEPAVKAELVKYWQDTLPSGQPVDFFSIEFKSLPEKGTAGEGWLQINGRKYDAWRASFGGGRRSWFRIDDQQLNSQKPVTVGWEDQKIGRLTPPFQAGDITSESQPQIRLDTAALTHTDSVNITTSPEKQTVEDTRVVAPGRPSGVRDQDRDSTTRNQQTASKTTEHPPLMILGMAPETGGTAQPAQLQNLPDGQIQITLPADRLPFPVPDNTESLRLQVGERTFWNVQQQENQDLQVRGPRKDLDIGEILTLYQQNQLLGRLMVYRASTEHGGL